MPDRTRNIHFFCPDCEETWVKPDSEIAPDPEDEKYYDACPLCGEICEETGFWINGLLKMKKVPQDQKHYSPEVRKFRAEQARQNLKGPKTPEGKLRAGLNTYKHGKYSKKLFPLLAPANYGKYSYCEDCEYAARCKDKEFSWCYKNIGQMLKFFAAYINNDPAALRKNAAMSQAQLYNVLQMAFHEINTKGIVVQDIKKWSSENSSGSQEFNKANPALEHIIKIISALGFDAEQQTMTPKSEKDTDLLEGFLKKEPETLGEFLGKNAKQEKELLAVLRKRALPNENEDQDRADDNMNTESDEEE
jgi:hypothetical protein